MDQDLVAPRAGARIETVCPCAVASMRMSPPVRGRGLKHIPHPRVHSDPLIVAPRAGARIETLTRLQSRVSLDSGRPPCGGAD